MPVTSQIGFWSYSAATLAFIVLGLLLAISWRGRLAGGLLTSTAIINACWAATVAVTTQISIYGAFYSNIFELFRSGCWFAFLGSLLLKKNTDASGTTPSISRSIFWIGGLFLLLGLLLEWPQQWLSASTVVALFFGTRVVLAIIGLILIEHLYRNVSVEHRWTIKFLCLGIGAMFAYDLVLYSDAMLFHQIDQELWNGRGIANVLIVPLIAISAARNPEWSLDIAISRRVVFQSSALLGAGTYLLIIAGAGYYMRYFGGSWGGVIQAVILFAGIVGLFVLALSGSLRAKLRVFVNKNFFSYRYDYREEWLRITQELSFNTSAENFGQRAIHALANLVESRGGGLWLQQEDHDYQRIAHWDAPTLLGTESANSGLVQFLSDRQWVINLQEYRKASHPYGELVLPEWLTADRKTWLVVPLMFQDRMLGFVVLIEPRTPLVIDWEINDLLKTAGRQIASYLAQIHASQALLVARQFESFNRMSAFVVHDLKNLVAQLSLLVTNASKHRNNPEFQQDMIETVQNASEKMKRLLGQLRVGATPVEQAVMVNLNEVAQSAVASKAPLIPAPVLIEQQPAVHTLAHRERLERVIGHLLQNAAEATTQSGQIWLHIKTENDSAIIEVQDTGVGMSPEFIQQRLFRPFESTKQNGMGIGIYESREYVRELGGQLDVTSREGEGSCFRISLPLIQSITHS